MRQHEAVVKRRSPAYQRAVLRFAPEPCEQSAHEQLLREAHAGIGRHFERAEFHETETPGRTIGGIKLVDADFRAMRVAGDIDEKIAEQTIDEPERRRTSRVGFRD